MTTPIASYEGFRTYGNYLRGWRLALEQAAVTQIPFGPAPANPGQLTPGREAQITECLHRSWGGLRALEILNTSGIAAEVLAAHPPIAYYAVHNASRAMLFSKNVQASPSHNGVLRQMAQECEHGHVPAPWSAHCEAAPTSQVVKGLGHVTWPTSNLETVGAMNAVGFVALSLKTTRSELIDIGVAEARGGRLRAPVGTRRRLESSTRNTTVFDMFYRYRREAHYGKADNFTAFVTEDEGTDFGADLFAVVDATTWMLETRIHDRVGRTRLTHWYEAYMAQHSIILGDGPVGRRRAALGP